MNKYSTGYALINIFAALGVVLIFISFIIGALVSREGGGLGYVIIIFGAFQGVIIVGMGSIGRAVLDGSIAQQELLHIHQSNKEKDRGRHNKGGSTAPNVKKPIQVNVSEPMEEVMESQNSWALVDKVEMLASSGNISDAVIVLGNIEDTSQFAWASLSVAEAYNATGDYGNFKKYADEAILAASQINDSEERDTAINAIRESLHNLNYIQ